MVVVVGGLLHILAALEALVVSCLTVGCGFTAVSQQSIVLLVLVLFSVYMYNKRTDSIYVSVTPNKAMLWRLYVYTA